MMIASGSVHAIVNAMVKSGPDRTAHMALMSFSSAVVVVPALPFVALPHGAWGWLALSIMVHLVYFQALVRALDLGDLSSAYPIFRGVAPMLSAVTALVWLREPLSALTIVGIVLIGGGMLTMIAGKHVDRPTLKWSLFAGVTIAAYTVIDAVAVRASVDTTGFIIWFFLALGLANLGTGLVARGPALLPYFRDNWRHGGLAGALSVLTFGLALAALSMGDVAPLAALRETGMVTALFISIVFLKEPVSWNRALAILAISAGAVIILMGQV
jgi:drug/metabolite transporter (DMT)-like permease